jgi:adenine/guanine phosphoribosyltransferase-like PRPP-binding protein
VRDQVAAGSRQAAGRGRDRVLPVDDWKETGSQALTALDLVRTCGAELTGISVITDEAADSARALLPAITAVIRARDLP